MNKQESAIKNQPEPSGERPKRGSALWRFGRFCLLGLATLATLLVLFHLEENWRGKRAWKAHKAKMEAQGAVFELSKLAPPPVPDDKNFAMTPLLKPLLDLYPPNTLDAEGKPLVWKDPDGKARAQSIIVDDPKLSEQLKYGPNPGEPPPNGVELPDFPDWRLGQRFNLAEWQRYYAASTNFPSWPQPRTPAEDVLEALSRYHDELAELQKASKRPYSRFNIEYDSEEPFSILLPHLGVLRNIAKVVQLRAVAEIHAGDMDAAFDDVNLMFSLADSIKDDPFLIDYLVRLAILQLSDQAVWEGLQDHRWTPDQLAALQTRLANLDLVKTLKLSMIAERAAGAQTVERLAADPGYFQELVGDTGEPSGVLFRLIPKGWVYLEALNHSRVFDEYLLSPLPERAEDLDVRLMQDRFDALGQKLDETGNFKAFFKHELMMKLLIPALGKVVNRGTEAQAMNDMAMIAMALERYHLANNSYPESLGALSPKWIDRLPNDPVTQQAFRYEKVGSENYRLWSVGWDMKDDGGVVFYTQHDPRKKRDRGKGDWVWPTPGSMQLRESD